jgi:hypothetical protein
MNYDAKKYDPNTSFEVPPVGKHRLRIEEAEPATSKKGNDMFKVTFSVSGFNSKVFHYFVDNEYLQQNIDPFFDSFGIKPGDFNILNWRGKVGAADIKHEMYNDNPQARVRFFVLKSKQDALPAWREKGQVASLRDDEDVDCPF